MAHGKLSLKKIKVHPDMSEETNCYSAELYEDGKLKAYVSNEGRGGCDRFVPAKGLVYKDIAHLENMDVEIEIGDLLQEWSDLQWVKKNQTKKFVLEKDGKNYTMDAPKSFAQLKKVRNYKEWLEKQKNHLEAQGYKILNTNL